MDTEIRDFLVKYKEKLKNDKDIKERKLSFLDDYRDRIKFRLNLYVSTPGSYCFVNNGTTLFTLDEEDLEYLHKKYSKKAVDEMKQNISEIEGSYKDSL